MNPGPPGLLRTGKSFTEYASPVLYLFRTLSRRICLSYGPVLEQETTSLPKLFRVLRRVCLGNEIL